MKAFRLVVALAVFAAVAGCRHQSVVREVPPSSFSLKIERTDKGIAAQCIEGCRWNTLTVDCAACVHRIDAAGVGPAWKAGDPAVTFAFNLQEFEGKFVATSIKGTAWTKLSWSCGLVSCSASLDASGVTTGS